MSSAADQGKLTIVVRPNSMDDVLTRYALVALSTAAGHSTAAHWDSFVTRRQAGQQSLAGLLQVWPCGLCDVLGNAPSQAQLVVGGVDNGCHLLLGQVALHYLHAMWQCWGSGDSRADTLSAA